MSGPRGDAGSGGSRGDVRARLKRAVGEATRDGSSESRDALKAVAHELVAELRRNQEPPERVLLQIKELLSEAGLRPSYPSPDAPLATESTVYRDVIQWSIRSYYGEEGNEPPGATRA